MSGEYQLSLRYEFKPIGLQDIREAIGKIKTSKDSGVDGVSSFFLKLAFPVLDNFLARMFDASLESGVFPESWKMARVTSIYKDDEKAKKSNYRFISVLTIISKIFEKLGFNQLYQYLNRNHLPFKGQYGFRELLFTIARKSGNILSHTERIFLSDTRQSMKRRIMTER